MLSSVSVPSFDGKTAPFSNYEQQVELGRKVTNLEPARLFFPLILHVGAVARQVCGAAEGDVSMDQDGAERISESMPQAVRSVQRSTSTIDTYIVHSDLPLREAESKMQMGGAFREISASALRMQTAALCRKTQPKVQLNRTLI